jgi:hypothetical protein
MTELQNRVLLELRRAAYGSDIPAYVSAVVLASRVGIDASELEQLLNRLVEQRLIFPGLTPGTYGIREWPLDRSAG